MRSPPSAPLVVVLLVLAFVGCSSEAESERAPEARATAPVPDGVPEPTATTSRAIGEVDETVPGEQVPDSSESLSQSEGPTALIVDGVEIEELTPNYECGNGACSEPMDYWNTQDFVVAVGAEVLIKSTTEVELLPNVRRLSSGLSFLDVDRETRTTGTSAIVMETPGLYHVDVRADIEGETAADLTRIRYYMWVLVVEESAECLGGAKAVSSSVTGVTDASGCPVNSGSLSISSLHPDFHCAPWPATLSLDSRPGARFAQTGFGDPTIDVVASAPEDLLGTGAFIEAGEIFAAESDLGAIYVRRPSGELERWGPDEGRGCA